MFYRLRRVMGPKSERNVLKVKKGHVKVQTERRPQGAENIVKAKGHGMKGAYQVASSNKDLSAAVDKLKVQFLGNNFESLSRHQVRGGDEVGKDAGICGGQRISTVSHLSGEGGRVSEGLKHEIRGSIPERAEVEACGRRT